VRLLFSLEPFSSATQFACAAGESRVSVFAVSYGSLSFSPALTLLVCSNQVSSAAPFRLSACQTFFLYQQLPLRISLSHSGGKVLFQAPMLVTTSVKMICYPPFSPPPVPESTMCAPPLSSPLFRRPPKFSASRQVVLYIFPYSLVRIGRITLSSFPGTFPSTVVSPLGPCESWQAPFSETCRSLFRGRFPTI